MASLADLLKHIKETGQTLSSGYPRAKGFANALMANVERNVPTTQELQNPAYMQQRALNYMSPMAGAIKAYHGTPHKFDRFDMSKIGTGEGAQVYGHGLYFAENPEVAEQYRKQLSLDDVPYFSKGNEIVNIVEPINEPGTVNWALNPIQKGIDNPIYSNEFGTKNITELLDKLISAHETKKYGPEFKYDIPSAIQKVQNLKDQGYKLQRGSIGNIYETSSQWPDAAREAVDPLSEHHLLNLDKSFHHQSDFVKQKLLELSDPYVTKAIHESPKFNENGDYWDYMGNSYDSKREALEDITPQDLITGRRGNFKNPAELSKLLNQVGIPGSKYLDQGSRTGGGTSNYVMFGDEYLQIVNRDKSLAELLKGK